MKVFKKYESVKAFEADLASTKARFSYVGSHDTTSYDFRFTGTHDYDEANKKLLFGDNNLAKKIGDAGLYETKCKIQKYATKRSFVASVVGVAPHVPNFIAGVPNSMIRPINTHVKTPVVTIGYNMSVSGGVDKGDIISNASQLLSAIIILEAKGVRVNLYALNHSKTDEDEALFAIKIKSSGQPLDLLKIAYPIAHPSMNRRHKFCWLEHFGPLSFDGGGYGWAVTDEKKSKADFAAHGLRFDNIFSYKLLRGKTAEQIVAEICK